MMDAVDMTAAQDLPGRGRIEAAIVLAARISEVQAEIRREMMRLAPVLCSCSPAFSWEVRRPPQASCPVHGEIVILADGEVIG